MLKYLIIASIALSAWACAPLPKELVMDYTPHSRWIYPPTDTYLFERIVPQAKLEEVCEYKSSTLRGCAIFKLAGSWCIIYIRDDPSWSDRQIQQVREHEIAHCNGWNHPGGFISGTRPGEEK